MENLVNQEVKMELFAEDADYRDVVAKAKELGINHSFIKKPVLIQQVNEMIAKINDGEVEVPVAEQSAPVVNEVVESLEVTLPEAEQTNEETEVLANEEQTEVETPEVEQSAEQVEQPTSEGKTKSKKWYEEEDAFPYQDGDVVEIVSGKDLIGRKVMVKQPSTKKNALKGYLIHPVTGNLQKTFISVDFDRIELHQKAGQPVDQEVENQVEEQDAAI